MEIQQLIIKSLYAELTDTERRQLDAWLYEKNHQVLYDRIAIHLKADGNTIEELGQMDVDAALKRVKRAVGEPVGIRRRRYVALRPLYRFAAAAAVVAGVIAGVWWYKEYTRVTPPELTPEVAQGIRSAIRHDHLLTEAQAVQPAAPLTTREQYQYGVSENEEIVEEMMASKRVKTYIDKEYWVTLPDGTLVHLADNSTLIYPERFGRGDRNVFIEGEGYFMVAHDRSRRFIVHTPHGQICDYGTEFDVNTRDVKGTSVVLVSGRVGVIPSSGKEQMMQPGQKAEIVQGSVAVKKVDTAPYTAWNTGKVEFRGWTLQRIMSVISKWYGRRVVFRSEQSEQKTFTGTFDRFDSIESTVEALRAGTGLQITIDNDQLIVY